MKQLEVVNFIRTHPDWEQILSGPPYFIQIKWGEKLFEGLVLLKYNQIDSDLSIDIVQECRGLILDSKDDWRVVRFSFSKFFNWGEKNAAVIDWSTARVQAKIDGSIISTWWWPREKAWIDSTKGTINAYDTKVASQSDTFLDDVNMTFGEVFDVACEEQNFDWGVLKPGCTYTFELVSPYSRVVVPYSESKIYHLATRNNETLEEFNDDIGIEKPKEYPLHSLDATIKAAEALNKEGTAINDEGFVVVDGNWHRIKIKSPLYLTAAYMVNKKLTIRRALDITLAGERDEFLSYFPSSVEAFDELDKLIDRIVEQMERSWLYAEATLGENCSMKDLAGFVANMRWKSWCFYKKRNPDADAKTFLMGLLSIRDLIKDYWENKDDPLQWTVVDMKSKK